jgi:2-dehydropantoate 2-reductase
MIPKHDILVYGAGAIGASVAGWMTPHYDNITLLARGEHAARMKADGLMLYMKKEAVKPAPVYPRIVGNLADRPGADVVVIAVKNYDLERAAQDVFAAMGDRPVVVSLQNGLENQRVLPAYFSRVIYGVICYSAWRDAPGVIGAEKKGPILLGITGKDAALTKTMAEITHIFNLGLEAIMMPDIVGAAHSKLVLNLTNSVLTLVGHGFREIKSYRALKKITLGILLEGIEMVKREGHRETSIPGSPAWGLLKFANMLPDFISDAVFTGDFKKLGLNSMAQDLFVLNKKDTELESLNGYFIALADRFGMKAPFNRTIYRLCRERFARSPFVPMSEEEVWAEVQKAL